MREIVRPGALQELEGILSAQTIRSVLLVHGQSFEACGASELVNQALDGRDVESFVSPSAPYLDLPVAENCINQARAAKVEMVIAVGGGRILDLAKLAAFGLGPGNSIAQFLQDKTCHSPPLPLIAIPTTAGSGSQATHFAVLFQDKVKHSLAHVALLPQTAIVDSHLLSSCPPRLVASSGLDALCQAVESTWSVKSTEESRSYAKEALQLCLGALQPAVKTGDPEALNQLARAAHLSGKAINISFTTAAHACSYVLTSHYGVAHGHAVTLMLAPLCVTNGYLPEDESYCNDPRGLVFVRERMQELCDLFQVENPLQISNRLKAILDDLGLESSLSALNIPLPELLGQAQDLINEKRLGNNPRKLNWDKIKTLYQAAN